MNLHNNTKAKRGFTIIEVVLVLAVAGLIFLMVFIALPALQRSQRDTQRRNDYSMLSTAITSYSTNNGGKLNKLTANKASGQNYASLDPSKFINATGEDPNGHIYELRAYSWTDWVSDGGAEKEPLSAREHDTTVRLCQEVDGTRPDTCNDNEKEDVTVSVNDDDGTTSQVFVITKANCDGSYNGHDAPAEDNSSKTFVVYGYMESGTRTFCLASQ